MLRSIDDISHTILFCLFLLGQCTHVFIKLFIYESWNKPVFVLYFEPKEMNRSAATTCSRSVQLVPASSLSAGQDPAPAHVSHLDELPSSLRLRKRASLKPLLLLCGRNRRQMQLSCREKKQRWYFTDFLHWYCCCSPVPQLPPLCRLKSLEVNLQLLWEKGVS